MQPIQTVLFDLDGTLLDTAPDLAYALNILRRAHEMPELSLQVIKPTVGNGSKSMLKLHSTLMKHMQTIQFCWKPF